MVIVQCVLVFLISACNNINNFADNSDDKIVFMAGYKPQANLPFAVAYVAKEKGFFEELNLDVNSSEMEKGLVSLLLKSDITEELDRLSAHTKEAKQTLILIPARWS